MSFAQLNDSIIYLFWGLVRDMFWGSLSICESLKPFFPVAITPDTHSIAGDVINASAFSYSLPLCEFHHLEPLC